MEEISVVSKDQSLLDISNWRQFPLIYPYPRIYRGKKEENTNRCNSCKYAQTCSLDRALACKMLKTFFQSISVTMWEHKSPTWICALIVHSDLLVRVEICWLFPIAV
jgi:hypothetical protein